ncbi:MAG: S9 family peptidase [Lentimicrobium sp.]|nr:S9 family peptidase [Lentimicrobium sp.]
MKLKLIVLFLLTGFLLFGLIQAKAQERIPLNPGVYDDWKSIERAQISSNGNFVSYEVNPQSGDGILVISGNQNPSDTIYRGYESVFSSDNSFFAYKIKPFHQTIRKAKLDGKKKDELPKDSMGISAFNGRTYRFAELKSFTIPAKSGNFVAALLETPKPSKEIDSSAVDTTRIEKKAENNEKKIKNGVKPKKKDKTETYTLKLVFPSDSLIFSRDSITDYTISEKGKTIAWSSYSNDSLPVSSVYLFETVSKQTNEIFKSEGYIRNLSIDSDGNQLAFMHSSDTADAKRFKLIYYKDKLITAADTASEKLPEGYSPGENGKVWFSMDGSKLYFGIAPTPRPEPKDTLTEDEKAKVDLWHWQDPQLQPQQLKQLEKEKKRTYLTVFFPANQKIIRLADELVNSVTTGFKGNGRYALGFSEDQYMIETSWKDANYRDVDLIDTETGERKRLLTKHDGPVSLSTTQKYLAWYNKNDSLWYTMDLKTQRTISHFAGKEIAFYDEEHDVPSTPGPVGYAGWTQHDRQFVVYDRFDLWGLDPSGKQKPVSLTANTGRSKSIKYRNIRLNADVDHISNENGKLLMSSFNETNKDAGFSAIEENSPGQPIPLLTDSFKYTTPIKARDCDSIIWTRSNFKTFSDLWLSNLEFVSPKKLSNANPQQNQYLWGSVELVTWKKPDGKTAEGLLYKPENFDPEKSYPMLVYFYEKYTDQLHQHYVPKPSRSIISPTYCSSNGYLVFIPDISYRDGYPGQSAYEAIISGTEAMIAKGFVDKNRIGIQGQSWGGYQTAWLVTRTNLFKAAMAGAPVSNMTSAYGGIRWESGMVRQFQYEEGQSRIGANLWERPDLYIENSPIFKADKIETPLLIMSNDGDGAVPWYQGIELFTALRRLGKPAWLLNYNGDEHNLARRANMKDLDIRMMQFFDHYLKGAQTPEWMVGGIKAIDKGKKNGFELVK